MFYRYEHYMSISLMALIVALVQYKDLSCLVRERDLHGIEQETES